MMNQHEYSYGFKKNIQNLTQTVMKKETQTLIPTFQDSMSESQWEKNQCPNCPPSFLIENVLLNQKMLKQNKTKDSNLLIKIDQINQNNKLFKNVTFP